MECTINGIGERAGNAALEEIVMALHVRKAFYNPRFGRDPADARALTNIATTEIYKSSRLVSTMTGMAVQANKGPSTVIHLHCLFAQGLQILISSTTQSINC